VAGVGRRQAAGGGQKGAAFAWPAAAVRGERGAPSSSPWARGWGGQRETQHWRHSDVNARVCVRRQRPSQQLVPVKKENKKEMQALSPPHRAAAFCRARARVQPRSRASARRSMQVHLKQRATGLQVRDSPLSAVCMMIATLCAHRARIFLALSPKVVPPASSN
jgi:hypothetical protein